MKRGGYIKRNTPLPRGPGPKRGAMKSKRKPKAERDAKFAREFGSAERVAYVASLPCIACGGGPCENHHISGHAMGKRAHHSVIVPLCARHHREWHDVGRHTFAEKYHVHPGVEAERVAKAWHLLAHGQPFHEPSRQSDAL